MDSVKHADMNRALSKGLASRSLFTSVSFSLSLCLESLSLFLSFSLSLSLSLSLSESSELFIIIFFHLVGRARSEGGRPSGGHEEESAGKFFILFIYFLESKFTHNFRFFHSHSQILDFTILAPLVYFCTIVVWKMYRNLYAIACGRDLV